MGFLVCVERSFPLRGQDLGRILSPLGALVIALSSCNRPSASASAASLREVLAAGLDDKYNRIKIPKGTITIMSPLTSQVEAEKPSERIYNQETLQRLRLVQHNRLISLRELPQTELEAMARMGATTVIVTPTQLASDFADREQPDTSVIRISLMKSEIATIVRDTAYSSPALPQSEEYRLVLGTYRSTPAPYAIKELAQAPTLVLTHKFRAVVKIDPFTKKYIFLRGDQGTLGSDDWQGNSVR